MTKKCEKCNSEFMLTPKIENGIVRRYCVMHALEEGLLNPPPATDEERGREIWRRELARFNGQ